MASRRMFSLRFCTSMKFLSLNPISRDLYMQLCLNADDRGIVEAFIVIRMLMYNIQELEILEKNKLIINIDEESLIYFIPDWIEHNKIRSDRFIESMHIDKLREKIIDVKFEVVKTNNKSKQTLTSMTTNCQPTDNKLTTNCQPTDGIGEYRLVKDSKGECSIKKEELTFLNNYFKEEVLPKYFNQYGFSKIKPEQLESIYQDKENFLKAIEKYKSKTKKDKTPEKYIYNFSTFCNLYKDYIEDIKQENLEIKQKLTFVKG